MNTDTATPAHVAASHSPQQLEELVLSQRAFFAAGHTRSYTFRIGQLRVLRKAVMRYEQAIITALRQDLHKDSFEAYGTELGQLYQEISFAEKHLKQWMQPQRRSTPLMFFPSHSSILPEPRGTSLIIGPWNYPFMLVFRPLVTAIAAGCTAIIKPSEEARATVQVIRDMVDTTWESDYIACVDGPGPYVHEHLTSRYAFGCIFFTGSPAVGSIIMRDAAQHLTPVVLELGGKCPCIVAPDANLRFTARKIVLSKWLNAGQTCVAIDYLLVHKSIADKLLTYLTEEIQTMYGHDAKASDAYGRIINAKHFTRLTGYLQDATIHYGGQHSAKDLYIAPTIVNHPPEESALMHDEIFGPILPVITYESFEEAASYVNRHPHPLALYLYTNSRAAETFFVEHIPFGGGCINNGLVHLGNPNLPFGGVGRSGMGNYVGKAGFDAFTHYKSIVKSPTWFDTPMWYPPRKAWYHNMLRRLLR